MFTVNAHAQRFLAGKKVIVKKSYKSGSVALSIGDIGLITKISVENFPDLGLFDLRIIHMEFSHVKLSMGEGVADTFMDPL